MLNIICLSTQNWDDQMWTNKQHIMSRLSSNNRVIYVDRGVLGLRNFVWKKDLEGKWEFTWQHAFSLFEERTPNLTVLTEKLNLPNNFGFKIWLLKQYLKRHPMEDMVLWIYQPEYEAYIGQLGESLVVYDCVDEYSTFPAYSCSPKKKAAIIETEKRLMAKADLVITSAPNLYESKKSYNPNTYLVHNVGDNEHFMKVMDPQTEIAEEMKGIKHPVIGFVGALDSYKVNFELLETMAKARPEWSIVLIGPAGGVDPSTRTSLLKKVSNIHILGTKEYQVLPNYIKAFDVCIIPYNLNDYTMNCFPIKFFEFMATGKPVVTSNLPALQEFAPHMEYAQDNADFIRRIEKVLQSDPAKAREKRLEIARANSWPKRIDTILGLINQKLNKKT